MEQTPLERGIAHCGNSQSRFAAAIGTSQQNISNWVKAGRPLPAEFVLKAEAETSIPRYVWRPDIYPPHEAGRESAAA